MSGFQHRRRTAVRVLRAAFVAGVTSGAPSALAALRARRDPFEPTRAAGRMLKPDEQRLAPLLGSATAVHSTLSVGWASVIAATIPRGAGRARSALHGALMGTAIAGLDLGLAHILRNRRLEAIAELDVMPQVADHVLFGVIAGTLLAPQQHS